MPWRCAATCALVLWTAPLISAQTPKFLRAHQIITPDWSYYHKTDQLIKLIDGYAVPGRCPALSMKRVSDETDPSYVVKDTQVLTFTNRGGSAKPDSEKLPALALFGEHARELITSETALHFIAILCAPALEQSGHWGDAAAAGAALAPGAGGPVAGDAVDDEIRRLHKVAKKALTRFGKSLAWVNVLLDHVMLKTIPIENHNGRRMVEGGNYCHRMNGRSVDINRNYDNHFGVHAPEYLPSEEYEGTKAFSEAETRITRDVAKGLAPAVFVSYHAGIREMYMPYDWQTVTESNKPLHEVMNYINKKHCQCRTGSAGTISGYHAFGTTTDYMWEIQKARYVYTWEIAGDVNAPARECFLGFNPTTRKGYDDDVANWAMAFLSLVEEVLRRDQGVVVDDLTAAAPKSPPQWDGSQPDKNAGPRSNKDW